jgi:hypothetical protein
MAETPSELPFLLETPMRLPALPFLALLLLAPACTNYKVQVRLEGQPTTSISARMDKADGFWTVDVVLPPGQWTVKAQEADLAPRLLLSEGRQHVRFELPPGRLLTVRPVELTIQAVDGQGRTSGNPLRVTVDHYTLAQRSGRYS